MKPELCPKCLESRRFLSQQQLSTLHEQRALNPLSRRTGTQICRVCANAEVLEDHHGLTWEQARIAAENDRQEALRLPKGMTWGVTHYPTGGLDEHFDRLEAALGDRWLHE